MRIFTRLFARLWVPLFFLVIAQPAAAQNTFPQAEIFGGFSYVPSAPDDFPRGNSAGFQAAVSYNFNRWLGVFGDFAGQYSRVADIGPNFGNISTDSSVYQYMAGPRFTKRTERVNVFGHAMAGGAAGRTNFCSNCRFGNYGFALGGGGGFDVNIGPRITIRPIQMDLIASFAEMLERDVRFGMGVVIRIGER